MNKSDTIASLAKALSQAQKVMEAATKDASNPFFKSNYADLSSVWEAAKKPLTDNGLSVAQVMNCSEGNTVKVETVLMHESGEWMSGTLTMPYLKADPQAVGSAITYARRYALAAMVGIIADEDDDGNKASGKGGGEKKEDKKESKEEKKTPELSTITFIPDKINEVKFTKKDKSQGTKYVIENHLGATFGTFSETFRDIATKASREAEKVEITYETTQFGNTIKTLKLVEVA